MNPIIVIPARYGSSRLPGKPLYPLAGVPMIVRTARQAVKSGYPVWVAYDDKRIGNLLTKEAVTGIMTRSDHHNGTERLAEVVEKTGWSDDTVIVNVQGDEPLLPPALITKVAETLIASPSAQVATLATPFDTYHSPAGPGVVKVVCNKNNMALYFSRAVIPYHRDNDKGIAAEYPYLRHIGLYAYRVAALKAYPHLAPTPLEKAEKLEQLRFLEHAVPVVVAITTQAPPPGVDCEEDARRIEAVLKDEERTTSF